MDESTPSPLPIIAAAEVGASLTTPPLAPAAPPDALSSPRAPTRMRPRSGTPTGARTREHRRRAGLGLTWRSRVLPTPPRPRRLVIGEDAVIGEGCEIRHHVVLFRAVPEEQKLANQGWDG